MSLFQMLAKRWNRSKGWNSVSDELAIQCVGQVRKRLASDVERMSRNESRGYIRARARSVVKRTVAPVASRPETPAELAYRLNSRVLETTTRLVHQHVMNQPARKPTRRVA